MEGTKETNEKPIGESAYALAEVVNTIFENYKELSIRPVDIPYFEEMGYQLDIDRFLNSLVGNYFEDKYFDNVMEGIYFLIGEDKECLFKLQLSQNDFVFRLAKLKHDMDRLPNSTIKARIRIIKRFASKFPMLANAA